MLRGSTDSWDLVVLTTLDSHFLLFRAYGRALPLEARVYTRIIGWCVQLFCHFLFRRWVLICLRRRTLSRLCVGPTGRVLAHLRATDYFWSVHIRPWDGGSGLQYLEHAVRHGSVRVACKIWGSRLFIERRLRVGWLCTVAYDCALGVCLSLYVGINRIKEVSCGTFKYPRAQGCAWMLCLSSKEGTLYSDRTLLGLQGAIGA